MAGSRRDRIRRVRLRLLLHSCALARHRRIGRAESLAAADTWAAQRSADLCGDDSSNPTLVCADVQRGVGVPRLSAESLRRHKPGGRNLLRPSERVRGVTSRALLWKPVSRRGYACRALRGVLLRELRRPDDGIDAERATKHTAHLHCEPRWSSEHDPARLVLHLRSRGGRRRGRDDCERSACRRGACPLCLLRHAARCGQLVELSAHLLDEAGAAELLRPRHECRIVPAPIRDASDSASKVLHFWTLDQHAINAVADDVQGPPFRKANDRCCGGQRLDHGDPKVLLADVDEPDANGRTGLRARRARPMGAVLHSAEDAGEEQPRAGPTPTIVSL